MYTSETRANKSLSAVCYCSQVNVWPWANRNQEPGSDSPAPVSPPTVELILANLQFLSFPPSLFLFFPQLHHPLVLILHNDNWNWFVSGSLKVSRSLVTTSRQWCRHWTLSEQHLPTSDSKTDNISPLYALFPAFKHLFQTVFTSICTEEGSSSNAVKSSNCE